MRAVRAFAALLMIGSALTLSACNTFEGMGRDISNAGQWIEDKAE